MARKTQPAKPSAKLAHASDSNLTAPVVPPGWLRRALFFARLSRAWDLRFEILCRTGNIGRWYSAVGNEVTTIASALFMQPNDALSTVHRDLGAVLALYLDPTRLAPTLFPAETQTAWDQRKREPREQLYRLMCQVLGRRDGFTQGIDRSFHYGILDAAQGIRHVGMISHLGAMLPVAAGLALAALQDQVPQVVVGFIGEGATSQGDFHETLNSAGVMKLPLVLVIENNQYAFSTPLSEQYACETLASRAVGYGIAGERFDGTEPAESFAAIGRAVERARRGDGATLLEAMLPRMRGHAEGDGSYQLIPEAERERFLAMDPLPKLEAFALAQRAVTPEEVSQFEALARELIESTLVRAQQCPEPAVEEALRSMYAPGEVASAVAKEFAS